MKLTPESFNRKRRQLLLAAGAAALSAPFAAQCQSKSEPTYKPNVVHAKAASGGSAAHVLSPLPYAETALAPKISAATVALHYGKHHRGYVDKLNELLVGDARRSLPLDALVRASSRNAKDQLIFNNAAQAWNHQFYWSSLSPDGGVKPTGALARAIDRDFGSFTEMRNQLAEAATSQFGSGWAWLVARDQALSVVKTSNAENPLTTGATPLLTIDVWEHAYYVDYRNKRAEYVNAAIDGLLNWRFAEANFAA